MADVVAGIIVEYYLIRARDDYDGLLLRLIFYRHIAIESAFVTYHLCAKQCAARFGFNCFICICIDMLDSIRNRIPIIVQVQLKAFCRKLAAGIALFLIIGKSGYGQRSSRIGLAYLTV